MNSVLEHCKWKIACGNSGSSFNLKTIHQAWFTLLQTYAVILSTKIKVWTFGFYISFPFNVFNDASVFNCSWTKQTWHVRIAMGGLVKDLFPLTYQALLLWMYFLSVMLRLWLSWMVHKSVINTLTVTQCLEDKTTPFEKGTANTENECADVRCWGYGVSSTHFQAQVNWNVVQPL